jgi:DNA repair protein RAD5
MLSALIQTNSESEEMDGQVAKLPRGPRQIKLNSAFRPVDQRKPMSERPSATLIIAPTSLLQQWADELIRSSKEGTMKIVIWHGQNRMDLQGAIERDGDDDKTIRVVITSYGTLASEHARSGSPVFQSTYS